MLNLKKQKNGFLKISNSKTINMEKEKKKTLHKLYIELVKLQKEIISSNLKLLVILEGRDAARSFID